MKVCGHCGYGNNDPTSQVCGQCGRALATDAPPVPPAQPIPPPTAMSGGMRQAMGNDNVVSVRHEEHHEENVATKVVHIHSPQATPVEPANPSGEHCKICGKWIAVERSFRCVKCGRGLLCLDHYHEAGKVCITCAPDGAAVRPGPAERPPGRPARVPPALDELRAQLGMVRIEVGTFVMGSPENEDGHRADESQHQVRITRAFELGGSAVTQEQWTSVMEDNPSHWRGADRPVERVNWTEAATFCNELSKRVGLPPVYGFQGKRVFWDRRRAGFRLPTEAEWEYAARAGAQQRFAGSNDAEAVAVCCRVEKGLVLPFLGSKRRDLGTQSTRSKAPNAWGLSDMSGNVWEWCWDWYAPSPTDPVVDPLGPGSGSQRIIRGGSWKATAPRSLRIAFRGARPPTAREDAIGFRLARNLG